MNLLPQPITDKHVLLDLIPQKRPFVMVDKLFYFSQEQIVSGLTISKDNLFAHKSVFNAAGLIENMAQTVALHTGYEFFMKKEPAPTGYIGAIKKVEIKKLPKVGQELVTTVTILHNIMGITLVKAEIKCNETVIALSEMKTALV